MTWLLAGLTTLLVSSAIAYTDRQSGGAVDGLLRWPLPFGPPPGPAGDLALYGGYNALLFVLALAAWGTALTLPRDTDYPEAGLIPMLTRLRACLSASGQRWPWYFIALILAGAGVAVARAYMGDLPANQAVLAAVVAITLTGHALFEPTVGQPAEPPRPTAAPVPPAPPSLDQRLELLRQSSIYRGQIQSVEVLTATPGAIVPLADDLAAEPLATLWRIANDGQVYAHQRETLQLLKQRDPSIRRRALLLTARGSGVEATLAAAVLDCVTRGGNVLAIGPDTASLQRFWDACAALVGRAPLAWTPRPAWLDQATSPDLAAEVLLATPAALHAGFLPRGDTWRPWLTTLDLVIVLDADAYRGVTGGHTSLVLRRLQRLLDAVDVEPAVLAVGLNLRDPRETCERLWHWALDDRSVVRVDAAPSAERRLVLWQPNLEATTAAASTSAAPRGYLDEAVALLATLVRSGQRTALVTTFASLTHDDLVALQSRAASEQDLPSTPTVVGAFAELWAADAPPPDCIVTFAFPGDLRWLEHETRHLAGPGGLLLFVIAVPTATAQFLVRRALTSSTPIRGVTLPPPAPFIPAVQPDLLDCHLRQAIAELPGTVDSLAGLGMDGLVARSVQGLVQQRIVSEADRYELRDPTVALDELEHDLDGTVRPALVLTRQVSIGQVPPPRRPDLLSALEQPVDVLVDATAVRHVDRPLANVLLYPGRILTVDRRRYQVNRSTTEPIGPSLRLQPFTGGHVTTVRIATTSVREAPGSDWKRTVGDMRVGSEGQTLGVRFRVGCDLGAVEERIEGYHRVSWLEPTRPAVTTTYSEPLAAVFDTRVLLLAFPRDTNDEISYAILHSLEHAIRAALPLVLDVREDDVGITGETGSAGLNGAPALFLYDLAPGGNGVTDALLPLVPALLEIAFELLTSCGCMDGCLACLRLLDCRRGTRNEELDKHGAIALLGDLLGRQETAQERLNRQTAVVESEEVAEAMRRRILDDIFPHRLRITVPVAELAPLRLYADAELPAHPDWPRVLADVDGRFTHTPRTVWAKKYPPPTLFGTIAHEYAHNWEFSGGRPHPDIADEPRPFAKTLLIEGFARWVEFKALEAAGYLSPMRAVEAYVESHPEYPVGFRFFRHLESKYGQDAPIRLFEDGWRDLDYDALLAESGCTTALLEEYQNLPADWFMPGDPPPEPPVPPTDPPPGPASGAGPPSGTDPSTDPPPPPLSEPPSAAPSSASRSPSRASPSGPPARGHAHWGSWCETSLRPIERPSI